jgi:hypothetical protein
MSRLSLKSEVRILAQVGTTGTSPDVTDSRYCWLLRAAGARPRSRRAAANKRQEFASPHTFPPHIGGLFRQFEEEPLGYLMSHLGLGRSLIPGVVVKLSRILAGPLV